MSLKLYLRGGVWHYRGTIAKRRLRGSTGIPKAKKELARRAVAEIETNQWKCNFDGPQAVLTFAQASISYRAAGKSQRYLEPIEDHFKDTLVKDITPGMIRQMAIELYGHCTGVSRNRLAIVPARAVINYAAASKLCAPVRVELFKIDTAEKDYATLAWVQAFRKEASLPLGGYALFMFLTGARPEEAMEADIDLPNATAKIHASKVGHERVVHLPEMLVAALANIPEIKGRGMFFYANRNAVYSAWYWTIERAGIAEMSPHCCRHGFITGLLRSGIDVKTVEWLADVSAATLLKTYAHAIKDRRLTNVLTDTPLTQAEIENARNQRKISVV